MDRIIARALDLAQEKFIAASGPGGQNVNKVASAVQLRLDVFALGLAPEVFARLKQGAGSKFTKEGEIVLTAREYRTQEQNRKAVRARLIGMMEAALHPPPKRKASQINRVGKTARLKAKKARGAVKANRARPRPADW